MIKEVIVVEGRDDTAAIKRAFDAETIETGGSAINKEILERIKWAQERCGVIILTDPDHAGERLRKIISSYVPGCKHAFIDRAQAERNGDIGVENATPEIIRQALAEVKTEVPRAKADIELSDLLEAGLIQHPEAARRRLEMGRLLGIGYGNAKTFFKRCEMFGITKEEFSKALAQIDG